MVGSDECSGAITHAEMLHDNLLFYYHTDGYTIYGDNMFIITVIWSKIISSAFSKQFHVDVYTTATKVTLRCLEYFILSLLLILILWYALSYNEIKNNAFIPNRMQTGLNSNKQKN